MRSELRGASIPPTGPDTGRRRLVNWLLMEGKEEGGEGGWRLARWTTAACQPTTIALQTLGASRFEEDRDGMRGEATDPIVLED